MDINTAQMCIKKKRVFVSIKCECFDKRMIYIYKGATKKNKKKRTTK